MQFLRLPNYPHFPVLLLLFLGFLKFTYLWNKNPVPTTMPSSVLDTVDIAAHETNLLSSWTREGGRHKQNFLWISEIMNNAEFGLNVEWKTYHCLQNITSKYIHSTSNPGNWVADPVLQALGFLNGECDPVSALWSSESRRNFQQVLSVNFVWPCKRALW